MIDDEYEELFLCPKHKIEFWARGFTVGGCPICMKENEERIKKFEKTDDYKKFIEGLLKNKGKA